MEKKMIKKMFIYILFIFNFESNSRAIGGDWVGNGASFAENIFLNAFHDIEYQISLCLLSQDCFIDDESYQVLDRLKKQITQEKQQNSKLIQFLPHGPFFIIQGDVKVAVTGLKMGSTVFINRDLINQYIVNPKIQPFNLQQATSILVHELGHHLGIADHHYLDQLGQRVANNQLLYSQFMMIDPRENHIGVQLVASVEFLKFSSMLTLIDEFQQIPLNDKIDNIIECPQMKDQSSQLIKVHFWNLSWQRPMSTQPILKFYIALLCRRQDGLEFQWVGDQIEVTTGFQRIQNQIVFNQDKINIQLKACPRNDVGECQDLSVYQSIQSKGILK